MNLKLSYLRRVKWLLIILLFPLASMAQQTYPKVTPEQGAGYSGNIRVVKNGFVPPLTNGLPSTAVKFTVPQGLIPFGIDTTGKRLWWYDQQADTIAWIRPGATGSGSGAPIGNLGNAYRIALNGNAKSLRGSYALIYDTLITGEIRGTVDTSKVLPEASTIIANGVYSAAPGGGHRYILVDDQFTYDNGNVTQANGWVMTRNPDGIQAQDTATGINNFYFGNQGIKNTALANNGSYNALKSDAQGNIIPTFISSGGGGTNNRQVYAGNGLNKVNDSTLELSVPYTNGLYPQLAVSYNNPTWISTLAYSKLTGVPDFATNSYVNNNFIPLAGTTTGSPVTGTIEYNTDNSTTALVSLDRMMSIGSGDDIDLYNNSTRGGRITTASDFGNGGSSSTAYFDIRAYDARGGNENVVYLTGEVNEIGQGSLSIQGNVNNGFKGLEGALYYGQNYGTSKKVYVQKGYVDSAIAAHTSGSGGRTYYGQSPLFKTNDSTFAIQYVSGSQAGALSATDWNTFNTKQNQLNGTGYVKQSGTTTTYSSTIPYSDISGAPASGVTSFNTRTGAITLISSDVISALTYVPENAMNKATSLVSPNNTTYPTTQAIVNAGYLTGNQNITLSGDVTGSGTTAITTTLANSGVTAGSYTNANVTVDAKGRVTSISNGSSGSAGFTETSQRYTDLSSTKTLTNTPKTGYIVKAFVNGVKYDANNVSVSGTNVTLSGYTLSTGDVVEIIYNY